jgi:hypothetical protein
MLSTFKKLEFLLPQCEYIFSLIKFTVNNQEHFQTDLAVHINTRNEDHHRRPSCQPYMFSKMYVLFWH